MLEEGMDKKELQQKCKPITKYTHAMVKAANEI